MKLKEYNTDILSHGVSSPAPSDRQVRVNNTFKSSVMDSDYSSTQSLSTKDRNARDNPLTHKV